MKQVFIRFNYQYANEDYECSNEMYSSHNNLLIIENVKEVRFEKNMVIIRSTLTPKTKSRTEMSFELNMIDNITIN